MKWLKIQEVAAEMGVSRATVQGWIDTGRLKAKDFATKPGGQRALRVRADWLDQFASIPLTQEEPPEKRKRRPRRRLHEAREVIAEGCK